jgi:hypothetical protein
VAGAFWPYYPGTRVGPHAVLSLGLEASRCVIHRLPLTVPVGGAGNCAAGLLLSSRQGTFYPGSGAVRSHIGVTLHGEFAARPNREPSYGTTVRFLRKNSTMGGGHQLGDPRQHSETLQYFEYGRGASLQQDCVLRAPLPDKHYLTALVTDGIFQRWDVGEIRVLDY